MTQTRKQAAELPEKESTSGAKDTDESAEAAAPEKPEAGSTPPPAKKPLGAKEVIPFAWKLVGESQGMILTLFKAIERAEVEAQLQRVAKEGYYINLRILEADAKIVQPKPPQAKKPAKITKKAVKKTRKKKAAKAAKVKEKAAGKAATSKRATRKKTGSSASTASTKQPGKKAARKAKPKKTTSAKPSKKTSASKTRKKRSRAKK